MKTLLAKSKKMKNKKGFTLIELIVVIVIIGILAAIVVPRLSGFSDSAKEAACEADARVILTAVTAIAAQDTDTTAPTADEIKEYAGEYDGTVAFTGTGYPGTISFTYTNADETYQTTVTDGSIASTAEYTAPE